jgi:hypothetical protein
MGRMANYRGAAKINLLQVWRDEFGLSVEKG